MNILVLSAGRRVELIQEFRAEIQTVGVGGEVIASDLDPYLSAACQIADRALASPKATSESFVSWLVEICQRFRIKLIIPTADHDLIPLTRASERLAHIGVGSVVSKWEFVRLCRDKRLTSKIFETYGLGYPRLMDKNDLQFPVFCKPFDGSSSVGAEALLSKGELKESHLWNERNIFQEYVDSSYCEFTCDLYFDRNSQLKCIVPRERLAVRAGEVSKGMTRRNFVYDYLLARLEKMDGVMGPLTMQVFGNYDSGDIQVIEINPRFGGGYPLTSASGVSYVNWLLREWVLGEEITFFDSWQSDLLMLRYDAKVLINVS